MGPFYGWGLAASKLESLRGTNLFFTTKFPEIPGTHFIDLGRLSRPWSHPVVLNTGPLDRESSVLTTRPLLLKLQHTIILLCTQILRVWNFNKKNLKATLATMIWCCHSFGFDKSSLTWMLLSINLLKLLSKETDCIDNYCTARHYALKSTTPRVVISKHVS